MTTLTVFRSVPPPIIGVCGSIPDRVFVALEERLDWLETTGVLVERFDPDAEAGEVSRFGAVAGALARESACLPLILVDGVVVSSGVRPTRSQLARLVGRNRRRRDLPAAG